MGFLDKLWDETVAGPAPESGLGKLRKYNSFCDRRTGITPHLSLPSARPASATAAAKDDQIPVSRSISILRRSNSVSPGCLVSASPDSGSASSSPATSTTPTSPFSPSTPRGNHKKLAMGKSTPTGYDWIVLTALDR